MAYLRCYRFKRAIMECMYIQVKHFSADIVKVYVIYDATLLFQLLPVLRATMLSQASPGVGDT
jgi:hypothetical protein